MKLPLGATRSERARAWAGEAVDPAGRDVLLVKQEDDGYESELQQALRRFWKGEAEDFEAFTPLSDLVSFTYTFVPLGYKYEGPTEKWYEKLDKYDQGGGTDEELRAEPLIAIYEAVFVCTRADRHQGGGVVEEAAHGMVRLSNEMRRRILGA